MASNQETRALFQNFLVATSAPARTYGKFGPWLPGMKMIKTTGAAATLSSNTANDAALAPIDVGDEIHVRTGIGLTDFANHIIVTNASDDVATVSATVNYSNGTNYQYRKFLAGTSADQGWIDVEDADDVTVQILVNLVSATNVNASVEGRIRGIGEGPTTLWTSAITASGGFVVHASELGHFDEVRVGFGITDDAGNTTVTSYATVTKLSP